MNIALIFPNSSYIGLSNYGFAILYSSMAISRLNPHRFFLEETGLFSPDTDTDLNSYDILLISISFQNDYINLKKISDIYIRNKTKAITIAGGTAISINPLPVMDLVDFIYLGEFEQFEENFINICRMSDPVRIADEFCRSDFLLSTKDSRIPVKDTHRAFEYLKDRYAFYYNFSSSKYKDTTIADTNLNHCFNDLSLIELSRGCPFRCSFCYIGSKLSQVRYKDPDIVIGHISDFSGKKWGLISSCHTSIPGIKEILKTIIDKKMQFSLSSLDLNRDYEVYLWALNKINSRSVTIAPETFSERLSAIINKTFHTDTIYRFLNSCIKYNIRNIKMYFLSGFPGEIKEDHFATLEVLNTMIRDFPRLKFHISLSLFVPKPYTPFQDENFLSYYNFRQLKKLYPKRLRGLSNLNLSLPNYRYSLIDYVLSTGDSDSLETLVHDLKISGTVKELSLKYTASG